MASASRVRLSRLLLGAALLHIALVIAINVAGRYELSPNDFDKRGVGISFAADSIDYLNSSKVLVDVLRQDGLLAWARNGATLHAKLYSLCYAALGGVFGYTTLSAEPLNLLYYLLILSLVFTIGREVFGRATGMVSALITALWPSLLLHTTQLLRDPLFIVLFLVIILVCVRWLTGTVSRRAGLMAGIAGGAASALVWFVRSQIWEVLLCAVFLAAAFLVFRQFRERRFAAGNLISCAVLCSIMIAAPVVGRAFNLYSYPAEQRANTAAATADRPGAQALPTLPPGSPLPARISFLRQKFIVLYQTAGSNIDTDVEFHSLADILRYLPRAMMIGLFAPFPNMWFVSGAQVGIEGRLLSGFETFLIYLMEALAVFALWRSRKNLSAWLLLLITLIAVLALGLVVPNIAALYRMRYGFWLLLIVLGAEGLRLIFRQSPALKRL